MLGRRQITHRDSKLLRVVNRDTLGQCCCRQSAPERQVYLLLALLNVIARDQPGRRSGGFDVRDGIGNNDCRHIGKVGRA